MMSDPERLGGVEQESIRINWRGEHIDISTGLLDDAERGPVYRAFAERYLPAQLFEDMGLTGGTYDNTGEWANVVEHSIKVAATALTMAHAMRRRGVAVDTQTVIDAGMVQDVLKRVGIEAQLTREKEDGESMLEAVLRERDYPEAVIAAASNTGRIADRYITDPTERMAAIAAKGPEAAIVALADAMMRGSRLVTLDEALAANITAKPRDAEFFTKHWYPYNAEIIRYLQYLAPGFTIDDINEDTVYATTWRYVAEMPHLAPRIMEYTIGEKELGEAVRVRARYLSIGKNSEQPEKNEDKLAIAGRTFVLADGSTPKAGNSKEINGRSGGQIAADIAMHTVLNTRLNGRELVDAVTAALADFYAEHNTEALEHDWATFATTFIAARVEKGPGGPELVITRVGNSGFRINGQLVVNDAPLVDAHDAYARAEAMQQHIDAGMSEAEAAVKGREAIMPSLNNQWRLWNNADHRLGFGYVNGRHVPDKFIGVHRYPLRTVQTLELFSDGYELVPQGISLKDWEEAWLWVQVNDPYRYKQFMATKTADDRSVAVLRFSPGNS
jgi:hypothetical protein